MLDRQGCHRERWAELAVAPLLALPLPSLPRHPCADTPPNPPTSLQRFLFDIVANHRNSIDVDKVRLGWARTPQRRTGQGSDQQPGSGSCRRAVMP